MFGSDTVESYQDRRREWINNGNEGLPVSRTQTFLNAAKALTKSVAPCVAFVTLATGAAALGIHQWDKQADATDCSLNPSTAMCVAAREDKVNIERYQNQQAAERAMEFEKTVRNLRGTAIAQNTLQP